MGLLNIYDGDDVWLARAADEARDAEYAIAVKGGTGGFVRALDDLVKQGKTFDRAVISTHGGEGRILFSGERIFAADWKKLAGRGYERIFPLGARIYFPGCNIAVGEAGWDFLAEAGKLFLRLGGGLVFAHDTKGIALGGKLSRVVVMAASRFVLGPAAGPASDLAIWFGLGGKVIHPWPWDTVKGYVIARGGVPVQRINIGGDGGSISASLASLATSFF